jgi:capsular polysaccharide transport system permease protein
VQGLFVQLQVIRALMLRETRTRFGEHKLGYIWALVEPTTLIGMFAAMYLLMGRTSAEGVPIVPFLATGMIPYQFFRETTSRTMAAIDGNKGLLFYPDIRPLDLVAARVLLEFVTNLIVFALIMGGIALTEGHLRVNSWLTTLFGLFLSTSLGAGLGLVLCGLSTFSNAVERIVGPILRPLFWVSAVLFSSNSLPPSVLNLFLWNPILHAVEIVRNGWFPGYNARHVSPFYPLVWILALLFFGLTLERVARRRIQLS